MAIAAREGNVREVCLGTNGETMNEEEQIVVKEKEDKHYANNWHKIIMPMMRFKNPSVASSE